MNKILLIARREFLTTISNRGFLFGLFIMPLLIGVAVLVGPRLLAASPSWIRLDRCFASCDRRCRRRPSKRAGRRTPGGRSPTCP